MTEQDPHLLMFRDAVLDALDLAARVAFPAAEKNSGARDEDLPELFRWVDAHYEKLKQRLGETF